MRFYLGTASPPWLAQASGPLCISHPSLAGRKRLPTAAVDWVADSGGFTLINTYGRFLETADQYADQVAVYQAEVGRMVWAAPQDWMCEPASVAATGLSVREHQDRTVSNYLDLAATGLPFIPVLQGWELADYLRCIDLYRSAGVDLAAAPTVGVGSICRRQNTRQIHDILATIDAAVPGIKLHGFGVKTLGLSAYADLLFSADSQAWSAQARRLSNTPGWVADHPHARGGHTCAACLPYAEAWRESIEVRYADTTDRHHQLAIV